MGQNKALTTWQFELLEQERELHLKGLSNSYTREEAKVLITACNTGNSNSSNYKITKTMSAKESFRINGEQLLNKVKELINEGNVTKITITDKLGKELISIPLTYGVIGVLVAPVLAAVGAMAALIGECTITVEREVPPVN